MRLREGSISVFSQGVFSLGNFLAVLVPAKALQPDDFGHYIVGLTTILLFAGLSRALVILPARILGVDGEDQEREQFLSLLIAYGTILAGLCALLSLPIMMVTTDVGVDVLLATSAAVAAFQFYDLSRAVRASRQDWDHILFGDVTVQGLRLVLLAAVAWSGYLDAALGLAIYALAALAGPVISQFHFCFSVDDFRSVPEVAARAWRYGRWLLLESFVSSCSTHLYVYFSSALLGPAAAGVLGALQQLVNAVNVVQIGIHDYILPHARRAISQGNWDLWLKWLVQGGAIMLSSSIVIVSMLLLFQQDIIRVIYSAAMSSHGDVLLLLCLAAVLASVNSAWSIAFRTAGQPQAGVWAKITSAVVSLSVGLFLVIGFGLPGAAAGVLLTQGIWLLVYLYLFLLRKKLSRCQLTDTEGSIWQAIRETTG